MAKIRVVVIEMDGADATVLRAIGMVCGAATTPLLGAEVIAPEEPLEIEEGVVEDDAIPRPVVTTIAEHLKKGKASKRTGDKKRSPIPLAPADDGCRGKVYAALERGALTSGELIARVKSEMTAASVYLALKQLREARLVETKRDDSDGQTKNFRVG